MVVHALKTHRKSDCASELSHGAFHKFADDSTIALHHLAPHEPNETSVVERHVGVIKAMACAVSYNAGFWPLMCCFAVEAACLQHSLHIGLCGVTPHQLDYGSLPSLQFLCTVGCLVYYDSYTSGNSTMHFDHAHAEPGILVSFDLLACSYKIYSLLMKCLCCSSEVVFHESTFPLKDPAQQVASQSDDEFALDLLVHGQQVGDAPVDLAQGHSWSDVSASPTSPPASPSVCPGASSPSESASPSPSPGP